MAEARSGNKAETPAARSENPGDALKEITRAAEDANRQGGPRKKGLPPVHLWNPPYCGELDIRIKRDGSWHYLGTPIGRERLVRLFSTVLRHDEDGKHYLVTPVEKIGIQVDDAPFLAVAMRAEGAGKEQRLIFTTNVGDETEAGPEHPMRFEIDEETGEPAPYVHVRARLEALINRAVFYDLVALGTEEEVDGEKWFGVWSGGEFFAMMRAADIGGGTA